MQQLLDSESSWSEREIAEAWDLLTPEERAEAEALLAVLDEQDGYALDGAETPWEDWVREHFPHVCSAPFGERHRVLWEWFERLSPGSRPRPHFDVWPRGGAKSTTTQLCVARACIRLARRFVLYVSETQDQANRHVQAIATLLQRLGVERATDRYGNSKGWRLDQIRTANGFNVVAYGLDAAARGIKLDHYRPDLVVLDDIDSQDDSEKTILKKIDAITTSIIPTGSADCAVLGVQNLIHEESIFSRIVDGRADFLRTREIGCVEPAVRDLVVETAPGPDPDSPNVYVIAGGKPTWAGQDLATCQGQLNDWGLRAFLREAQHEVQGASGFVFDVSKLIFIDADEVPPGLRKCRAWDLAATEGGGDWTAGALVAMQGRYPDVWFYILDMCRGQWGAEKVTAKIGECARMDGPRVILRLPEDPAQAGRWQAAQLRAEFADHAPRIRPVSGKKWIRARGLAEAVNKGNVFVVRSAIWNAAMVDEMRRFRENEPDQQDDQVDALADGFNELAQYEDEAPEARKPGQWHLPHALRTDDRMTEGHPLTDFEESWDDGPSYD